MKKSTILNIDINTVTIPFLEAMIEKPHLTEEDFYPFVDQYIDLANGKESGLAALSFCTFCQLSMVDSAYMTTFYDYMDRQIANGIDPQTNGWYLWPLYRILKETDFDPWAIWVDRCHQRGCEAWISIRMNDAHDRDYEEFMMDEFAYRAKWQDHAIGERYGYYWKCLDYAHDEVRARMLGYLDEQLARYDMDGLELDFMREIGWGPAGSDKGENGYDPWTLSARMVERGQSLMSPTWPFEDPFNTSFTSDRTLLVGEAFDKWLEGFGIIREGSLYRMGKPVYNTILLASHGGSSSAVISRIFNLPMPFVSRAILPSFTAVTVINFWAEEGSLFSPQIEIMNDARHIMGVTVENVYGN